MKTSDVIKQLPQMPMLEPYRKSLEASIEQFGDQEIPQDKMKEIEKQVRAYYAQFELKH